MKQKLLTEYTLTDTNNVYEDPIYHEMITDLEESNNISVEEGLYLRNFGENNYIKR